LSTEFLFKEFLQLWTVLSSPLLGTMKNINSIPAKTSTEIQSVLINNVPCFFTYFIVILIKKRESRKSCSTPCFFEEYYTTNKKSLLSNFFSCIHSNKKKEIHKHGLHLKVVPVILTLKDSPQCSKPVIAYDLFFAACDFVVSWKGNLLLQP